MKTIEVYRNSPMGERCEILTENVEDACIGREDVKVELYFFPCKQAEKRGIKKAPALVIDTKIVAENPSMDKIALELDVEGIKKLLE